MSTFKNKTHKSPFKETSHFTEADYKKYATLLNVPVTVFHNDLVGVMDYNDENDFVMLLFHYNPEWMNNAISNTYGLTDLEIREIKKVRGIAIPAGENKIACRSFPFTSSFVRTEVPEDGSFDFSDRSLDNPYSGTTDVNYYSEWIYGSLIRIFCYNNVTFISSHKKLSCANTIFGGSRKFNDILFEDQDVFKNIEDFFSGREVNDVVHYFILNDKYLMAGSSQNTSESRVFYIGSLNIADPSINETKIMTDLISSKNLTASKKIHFPKQLTNSEVNNILSGNLTSSPTFMSRNNVSDNAAYINSLHRDDALKLFAPCERVLMTNKYGVFTVMPPQAYFRYSLLDGKCNIPSIFADCVSYLTRPELNTRKIVIDEGFTYDQLLQMEDDLINGNHIDFSQFPDQKPTKYEIILTNLLFAAPRQYVKECFQVYNDFSSSIINTYDFLWSIKDELRDHVKARKLNEFPGFTGTGNVIVKRYINQDFLSCFFPRAKYENQKTINDIIGSGPNDMWTRDAISVFDGNVAQGKETKKIEYLQRNAVLCFIVNAPGNALFSLLNIEKKITKAKAAFAKRDALARESI